MTDFTPQITALYANRSLQNIRSDNMQASTRLSTGLRINDARDDAAGVAKAAQLSSRIVNLQRAASNASDGIQMLETAEGASMQVRDMLLRMRELALQSLNDTFSPEQRKDLDVEFQQLKEQLLQVSSDTVWNDHHILSPHRDLRHQVEPAQINSTAPINTSGPPTGNYALFLNGVEVSVALTANETPQNRLDKVVSAINAQQNQHGVYASVSSAGGLSLSTPDGRDLSGWFDPSVNGLNASHFGLGVAGQAQVTTINLAQPPLPEGLPTMTVGTGFVEFTGLGESSESIVPTRSAAPVTTSGAISIVGQNVYVGNGASANLIGAIDQQKNGLAGQPLRILFGSDFVNGNFETGSAGSTTVAGWEVYNSPVRLGGASTVAGFRTPVDSTPMGSEPSFVNANAAFTTSLTASGLPAGSGLGLKMASSNVSTPSYGVVHGPYIVSKDPVQLGSGASVSFDWKAQGGDDDFDVYAYLLNTETGETVNLLNRTGSSTGWSTATASVTNAGPYKFVFISGTYDATGGTIAGAQLFIDNVRVNGVSETYQPTAQDIAGLRSMVTYSNPRPLSAALEVDGTVIRSVSSTDLAQVTNSLQTQLQAMIDQGRLQNVRIERTANSLQLTSTVEGSAFNVIPASGSSSSVDLNVTYLQSNRTPINLIDPIAGASSASQGARVVQGNPLTEQDVLASQAKFLHIGDTAGDFVKFELPNFGPTGTILGDLVWDVAMRDPAFALSPLSALMAANRSGSAADVRSAAAANTALAAIDQALARTSEAQSQIGALVSRLDQVLQHLANTGDHTSGARSQIQDADYAREASRLSRSQLMEQVAMQALAQAQISPRSILKLLA